MTIIIDHLPDSVSGAGLLLPPCNVQDHPARPDVLEHWDGLGVGQALESQTIDSQHLVTWNTVVEKRIRQWYTMLIYT